MIDTPAAKTPANGDGLADARQTCGAPPQTCLALPKMCRLPFHTRVVPPLRPGRRFDGQVSVSRRGHDARRVVPVHQVFPGRLISPCEARESASNSLWCRSSCNPQRVTPAQGLQPNGSDTPPESRHIARWPDPGGWVRPSRMGDDPTVSSASSDCGRSVLLD